MDYLNFLTHTYQPPEWDSLSDGSQEALAQSGRDFNAPLVPPVQAMNAQASQNLATQFQARFPASNSANPIQGLRSILGLERQKREQLRARVNTQHLLNNDATRGRAIDNLLEAEDRVLGASFVMTDAASRGTAPNAQDLSSSLREYNQSISDYLTRLERLGHAGNQSVLIPTSTIVNTYSYVMRPTLALAQLLQTRLNTALRQNPAIEPELRKMAERIQRCWQLIAHVITANPTEMASYSFLREYALGQADLIQIQLNEGQHQINPDTNSNLRESSRTYLTNAHTQVTALINTAHPAANTNLGFFSSIVQLYSLRNIQNLPALPSPAQAARHLITAHTSTFITTLCQEIDLSHRADPTVLTTRYGRFNMVMESLFATRPQLNFRQGLDALQNMYWNEELYNSVQTFITRRNAEPANARQAITFDHVLSALAYDPSAPGTPPPNAAALAALKTEVLQVIEQFKTYHANNTTHQRIDTRNLTQRENGALTLLRGSQQLHRMLPFLAHSLHDSIARMPANSDERRILLDTFRPTSDLDNPSLSNLEMGKAEILFAIISGNTPTAASIERFRTAGPLAQQFARNLLSFINTRGTQRSDFQHNLDNIMRLNVHPGVERSDELNQALQKLATNRVHSRYPAYIRNHQAPAWLAALGQGTYTADTTPQVRTEESNQRILNELQEAATFLESGAPFRQTDSHNDYRRIPAKLIAFISLAGGNGGIHNMENARLETDAEHIQGILRSDRYGLFDDSNTVLNEILDLDAAVPTQTTENFGQITSHWAEQVLNKIRSHESGARRWAENFVHDREFHPSSFHVIRSVIGGTGEQASPLARALASYHLPNSNLAQNVVASARRDQETNLPREVIMGFATAENLAMNAVMVGTAQATNRALQSTELIASGAPVTVSQFLLHFAQRYSPFNGGVRAANILWAGLRPTAAIAGAMGRSPTATALITSGLVGYTTASLRDQNIREHNNAHPENPLRFDLYEDFAKNTSLLMGLASPLWYPSYFRTARNFEFWGYDKFRFRWMAPHTWQPTSRVAFTMLTAAAGVGIVNRMRPDHALWQNIAIGSGGALAVFAPLPLSNSPTLTTLIENGSMAQFARGAGRLGNIAENGQLGMAGHMIVGGTSGLIGGGFASGLTYLRDSQNGYATHFTGDMLRSGAALGIAITANSGLGAMMSLPGRMNNWRLERGMTAEQVSVRRLEQAEQEIQRIMNRTEVNIRSPRTLVAGARDIGLTHALASALVATTGMLLTEAEIHALEHRHLLPDRADLRAAISVESFATTYLNMLAFEGMNAGANRFRMKNILGRTRSTQIDHLANRLTEGLPVATREPARAFVWNRLAVESLRGRGLSNIAREENIRQWRANFEEGTATLARRNTPTEIQEAHLPQSMINDLASEVLVFRGDASPANVRVYMNKTDGSVVREMPPVNQIFSNEHPAAPFVEIEIGFTGGRVHLSESTQESLRALRAHRDTTISHPFVSTIDEILSRHGAPIELHPASVALSDIVRAVRAENPNTDTRLFVTATESGNESYRDIHSIDQAMSAESAKPANERNVRLISRLSTQRELFLSRRLLARVELGGSVYDIYRAANIEEVQGTGRMRMPEEVLNPITASNEELLQVLGMSPAEIANAMLTPGSSEMSTLRTNAIQRITDMVGAVRDRMIFELTIPPTTSPRDRSAALTSLSRWLQHPNSHGELQVRPRFRSGQFEDLPPAWRGLLNRFSDTALSGQNVHVEASIVTDGTTTPLSAELIEPHHVFYRGESRTLSPDSFAPEIRAMLPENFRLNLMNNNAGEWVVQNFSVGEGAAIQVNGTELARNASHPVTESDVLRIPAGNDDSGQPRFLEINLDLNHSTAGDRGGAGGGGGRAARILPAVSGITGHESPTDTAAFGSVPASLEGIAVTATSANECLIAAVESPVRISIFDAAGTQVGSHQEHAANSGAHSLTLENGQHALVTYVDNSGATKVLRYNAALISTTRPCPAAHTTPWAEASYGPGLHSTLEGARVEAVSGQANLIKITAVDSELRVGSGPNEVLIPRGSHQDITVAPDSHLDISYTNNNDVVQTYRVNATRSVPATHASIIDPANNYSFSGLTAPLTREGVTVSSIAGEANKIRITTTDAAVLVEGQTIEAHSHADIEVSPSTDARISYKLSDGNVQTLSVANATPTTRLIPRDHNTTPSAVHNISSLSDTAPLANTEGIRIIRLGENGIRVEALQSGVRVSDELVAAGTTIEFEIAADEIIEFSYRRADNTVDTIHINRTAPARAVPASHGTVAEVYSLRTGSLSDSLEGIRIEQTSSNTARIHVEASGARVGNTELAIGTHDVTLNAGEGIEVSYTLASGDTRTVELRQPQQMNFWVEGQNVVLADGTRIPFDHVPDEREARTATRDHYVDRAPDGATADRYVDLNYYLYNPQTTTPPAHITATAATQLSTQMATFRVQGHDYVIADIIKDAHGNIVGFENLLGATDSSAALAENQIRFFLGNDEVHIQERGAFTEVNKTSRQALLQTIPEINVLDDLTLSFKIPIGVMNARINLDRRLGSTSHERFILVELELDTNGRVSNLSQIAQDSSERGLNVNPRQIVIDTTHGNARVRENLTGVNAADREALHQLFPEDTGDPTRSIALRTSELIQRMSQLQFILPANPQINERYQVSATSDPLNPFQIECVTHSNLGTAIALVDVEASGYRVYTNRPERDIALSQLVAALRARYTRGTTAPEIVIDRRVPPVIHASNPGGGTSSTFSTDPAASADRSNAQAEATARLTATLVSHPELHLGVNLHGEMKLASFYPGETGLPEIYFRSNEYGGVRFIEVQNRSANARTSNDIHYRHPLADSSTSVRDQWIRLGRADEVVSLRFPGLSGSEHELAIHLTPTYSEVRRATPPPAPPTGVGTFSIHRGSRIVVANIVGEENTPNSPLQGISIRINDVGNQYYLNCHTDARLLHTLTVQTRVDSTSGARGRTYDLSARSGQDIPLGEPGEIISVTVDVGDSSPVTYKIQLPPQHPSSPPLTTGSPASFPADPIVPADHRAETSGTVVPAAASTREITLNAAQVIRIHPSLVTDAGLNSLAGHGNNHAIIVFKGKRDTYTTAFMLPEIHVGQTVILSGSPGNAFLGFLPQNFELRMTRTAPDSYRYETYENGSRISNAVGSGGILGFGVGSSSRHNGFEIHWGAPPPDSPLPPSGRGPTPPPAEGPAGSESSVAPLLGDHPGSSLMPATAANLSAPSALRVEPTRALFAGRVEVRSLVESLPIADGESIDLYTALYRSMHDLPADHCALPSTNRAFIVRTHNFGNEGLNRVGRVRRAGDQLILTREDATVLGGCRECTRNAEGDIVISPGNRLTLGDHSFVFENGILRFEHSELDFIPANEHALTWTPLQRGEALPPEPQFSVQNHLASEFRELHRQLNNLNLGNDATLLQNMEDAIRRSGWGYVDFTINRHSGTLDSWRSLGSDRPRLPADSSSPTITLRGVGSDIDNSITFDNVPGMIGSTTFDLDTGRFSHSSLTTNASQRLARMRSSLGTLLVASSSASPLHFFINSNTLAIRQRPGALPRAQGQYIEVQIRQNDRHEIIDLQYRVVGDANFILVNRSTRPVAGLDSKVQNCVTALQEMLPEPVSRITSPTAAPVATATPPPLQPRELFARVVERRLPDRYLHELDRANPNQPFELSFNPSTGEVVPKDSINAVTIRGRFEAATGNTTLSFDLSPHVHDQRLVLHVDRGRMELLADANTWHPAPMPSPGQNTLARIRELVYESPSHTPLRFAINPWTGEIRTRDNPPANYLLVEMSRDASGAITDVATGHPPTSVSGFTADFGMEASLVSIYRTLQGLLPSAAPIATLASGSSAIATTPEGRTISPAVPAARSPVVGRVVSQSHTVVDLNFARGERQSLAEVLRAQGQTIAEDSFLNHVSIQRRDGSYYFRLNQEGIVTVNRNSIDMTVATEAYARSHSGISLQAPGINNPLGNVGEIVTLTTGTDAYAIRLGELTAASTPWTRLQQGIRVPGFFNSLAHWVQAELGLPDHMSDLWNRPGSTDSRRAPPPSPPAGGAPPPRRIVQEMPAMNPEEIARAQAEADARARAARVPPAPAPGSHGRAPNVPDPVTSLTFTAHPSNPLELTCVLGRGQAGGNLNSRVVARDQARIIARNGHFLIEDLSSDPSRQANQTPITELKRGTYLRSGIDSDTRWRHVDFVDTEGRRVQLSLNNGDCLAFGTPSASNAAVEYYRFSVNVNEVPTLRLLRDDLVPINPENVDRSPREGVHNNIPLDDNDPTLTRQRTTAALTPTIPVNDLNWGAPPAAADPVLNPNSVARGPVCETPAVVPGTTAAPVAAPVESPSVPADHRSATTQQFASMPAPDVRPEPPAREPIASYAAAAVEHTLPELPRDRTPRAVFSLAQFENYFYDKSTRTSSTSALLAHLRSRNVETGPATSSHHLGNLGGMSIRVDGQRLTFTPSSPNQQLVLHVEQRVGGNSVDSTHLSTHTEPFTVAIRPGMRVWVSEYDSSTGQIGDRSVCFQNPLVN